ncbi:unnamed protein product [Mytilus coruscus]|uniref:Uncharacterized protein n=1 Tax=Mytilus coruscus TaxID=42192 RepID=A0A6J8DFV7_MYTCO|nr:unnamed protein product [Mytilus coruscus]
MWYMQSTLVQPEGQATNHASNNPESGTCDFTAKNGKYTSLRTHDNETIIEDFITEANFIIQCVNARAPTKDNISSINIHVQLSPKSKNRYAQKVFRERIKLDETLYKEYRQFETLRVKAFRVNMSPEQKEKYNEKTRLRMKKYREKKKSEGTDTASHPKQKTRKEKEKQREKWRKDKQLQRDNLNPQKKRRINEKRRKQYALQKQKTAPIDINTESDKTSTVPETASSSGYQTKCARRKAVSRSIKILPKNPDKFAEVVATIIKKSTPRKKAALKNKCIASPSSKKKIRIS